MPFICIFIIVCNATESLPVHARRQVGLVRSRRPQATASRHRNGPFFRIEVLPDQAFVSDSALHMRAIHRLPANAMALAQYRRRLA